MIASYRTVDRDLSQVAADADVATPAPVLIGSGQLLHVDRQGAPPDAEACRRLVVTILAGVAPLSNLSERR